MKKQIISTAIAVTVLAAGRAAMGAPTIVVTDGTLTSGPITGANGIITYSVNPFGDNWGAVVATARTKPTLGGATSPNMELDITAVCTAAGPDLVISFSDTDFGPVTGQFAALITGHTIGAGGAPVTFRTFYNPANILLAVTNPLTASGPLTSPILDLQLGDGITANPFSLTEVVIISGAAPGIYSLNANLQSISVSCAGNSGTVGVPYSSQLTVTGGSPCTNGCFNFTITSGSLPPGLHLDACTGAITGTPTQAGTFPYVAKVVDCDGRTADTSGQNCAITITGGCNGQIGDFVWNDLNGNGCQDAGEAGIAGVTVDLYAGSCSGPLTKIATTVTDSTGHYLFSGLCPSNYSVFFHTPSGYTHTTALSPSCGVNPSLPPDRNELNSKCDCTGSTDCSVCVTLTTANPNNLNVDCGYVPPCNGQIGDFVWKDKNGNGCQDAGEPGIANQTVDLYSGTCGGTLTKIATTKTDSDGHYLFTGLCPGSYTVFFHTPYAYMHTAALNPSCGVNPSLPPDRNELNSKCDCTGTADCAVCVTLTAANPNNLNVDCGFILCTGELGDFVWNDLDGNGCQDAGEPGIPNVAVALYSGCGSSATVIATTTTDSTGHYLFTGLCPGQYTVSFTTPAGFERTTAHAGCANNSNPPYSNQTDSKCDCAAGTPCGVCVMLTASSLTNLNVDCGYRRPTGPPLAHGDTATIGFWHNKNGQALILSMNGGPNSTALGTWLASHYPCIFGGLNGKANTVVAAQFQTYFNVTGQKTYAQVMAGALAVYATSSTLAGGSQAAAYGFNVSPGGIGSHVYNVGSNGTALGLSNNTSYTISQLLQAANAKCSGGAWPPAVFNALNTIFDGINQGGDIN
jgi:protocatechuate 3,4-dioxygenase beta subunit